MKILGIETSCDETAVSLIEASGEGADFSFSVLGDGLVSQAAMHAEFGGVFPNLAKREHAKNLVPLLDATLRQANSLDSDQGRSLVMPRTVLGQLLEREPELLEQLTAFLEKYGKPAIDVIAVTHGPGLEPALWVGVNFAKALSLVWNIPIVPVNHMEGHIVMSLVEHSNIPQNIGIRPFEFPLLSLLISGGHTELLLSREWMQYERLGETRDDAVGEAFDKVARLMGLPYPGGPEISKLAEEARERHLQFGESLTRPMMAGYDFSFSGLKTAVRRIVESRPEMSADERIALAREFEDTVTDVLVEKTIRAVQEFGALSVVVGGGVSANKNIRKVLHERLEEIGGVSLLIPPPSLATDNALMIALAGYFRALKGEFIAANDLGAHGNLRLE